MTRWLGLWLALGAGVGGRGQTPEFRWSHPLPHGNNIADLVVRAGVYHHVTDHGGIYASSNRVVWSRRVSGTTRDLRAAAWMGTRLLVTGEEGTALWSDDGIAFQPGTVTPATTDWFEGVAASATVAVAVGDNGAIYRSTNGMAWSPVGSGFTAWLSGVAQGNGVFVAVGEGGFIASSPDGSTWSRRTSGTVVDLLRVTQAENRFLVVGRNGVVLTSPNGTSWAADTATGVTNALQAATIQGNERLVVGESAVLLRGLIGGWANQMSSIVSPSPAPDWSYAASVWDGARYVVGGRTGVMLESYRTNALGWSGLTFWFRLDESPRNWLWDAGRVAGTYLAVGDRAGILSSANGIDWAQEATPVDVATVLYGVGGSPELALAAGSGGVLLRSRAAYTNVVVTNLVVAAGRTNALPTTNRLSLAGISWEATASGLTTNTLQGIGWNGARYLVVGGAGTVLSSPDGDTWSRGTVAGAGFLSGVTPYGAGWIACGGGGGLYASADGVQWTPRVSGTTNWVYRVRALGTNLVAVGQNGVVLTSANGVDWVSRTSGTDAFLTDVREAAGVVYACGTGGTLLASTNLVDWQAVPLPTGKSLNGLATAGGQLIVVGAEGAVLRAVVGGADAPVGFAGFGMFAEAAPTVAGFVFSGTPEQRFRLEGAGDLGGWTTDASLELDANGAAVLGRVAEDVRRFHRTRLAP